MYKFENKILIIIVISITITLKVNAIQPPAPPYKDVFATTTVDSGNIRIWYAFNASDLNKLETYEDLQRLEIGSSLSKYFSYFVYNDDSLITVWVKKHPKSDYIIGSLGIKHKNYDFFSEYRHSEYFKDFSTGLLTEYARMPAFLVKANSYYTEQIPVQEWIVKHDTMTIAGYLCQKAICAFRGRNFTAWFSPDIPINNGPWKFGGLPGLILKVYDNDNLYVFECIKIEILPGKFPIEKYDDYKKYLKFGREKILIYQKKIHEDFVKIAGLSSTDNNYIYQKTVYHPLELE